MKMGSIQLLSIYPVTFTIESILPILNANGNMLFIGMTGHGRNVL